MRGDLIVEPNSIEIPIQVYIKYTQATLAVPKKVNSEGILATRTTDYFDSKEIHVDSDKIDVVYSIGNEFINIEEIPKINEFPLSKGIHCVAFVDSSKISNYSFTGNRLEVFS